MSAYPASTAKSGPCPRDYTVTGRAQPPVMMLHFSYPSLLADNEFISDCWENPDISDSELSCSIKTSENVWKAYFHFTAF